MSEFQQSAARGYLVVFARFVLAFINMGISKTLGVFLNFFIEDLNSDASIVGMSCSMFSGLGNLVGPFTTIFGGISSPRQQVILGGILTTAGLGMCCVASSVEYLATGMFVAGTGQAFTQVPSVEPLFWYFPERFATANGISLAGGAVGMMILPPVSERLIRTYGWRNALGILAMFCLNVVVAGALLKRPMLLTTDIHLQTTLMKKTKSEDMTNKGGSCYERCSEKYIEILETKLNTRIFFTYPAFTLFLVIFLLNGLIYTSWVIFLVPHAISKGISLHQAVYLSTIGGIGAFVGRIGNGPLIDWKLISAINLYAVIIGILALCFILDILARTLPVLAVFSFTVGVCVGGRYPLAMAIAKSLVEEKRFNLSAIAWTYFFTGVGNMLAGPFTGWLYISTGSYTVAFIGLGATHAIIAVVVILYSWIYSRSRKVKANKR